MLSESFANSPNPFIRSAVARMMQKQNVPAENVPQKSPAANAVVQKQKWKMLKNIPGAGNHTWSAMSMLNKGLSPMNKSAGAKLDFLKNLGAQAVTHAKHVGDGAKTTGKVGLDIVKKHPVAATGTVAAGGLGYGGYRGIKNQIADSTQKLKTDVMKEVQPTLDNVNKAIAPFQGDSNSYLGGVWESFLSLLHRLFGGGRSAAQNKYMDPLTGAGAATEKAIGKTSSFNTGEQTMKPLQALQVALSGSPTFQKNASAGAMKPDRILQAHVVLADRMRKAAAWLQEKEADNIWAPVLRRSADWVAKGIPARVAVLEDLGRSQKLAAMVIPTVDALAIDIFNECVAKSYQKRAAALAAQKKSSGG